MTQAPLPMADTFTDAVADVFRARPNEWIDARELMGIGGMYAWRTRISDARKRGMVIENEWHTVHTADGGTCRVSRYRWVTEQAA